MIKIDATSNLSIHTQIVEGFKNLILSEVIGEDEQLPSVRNLASQLVINPNTIHKAYKTLETDGFIESKSGKGMFVKKFKTSEKSQYTLTLIEDFKELGKKLMKLDVKKEELLETIKNI